MSQNDGKRYSLLGEIDYVHKCTFFLLTKVRKSPRNRLYAMHRAFVTWELGLPNQLTKLNYYLLEQYRSVHNKISTPTFPRFFMKTLGCWWTRLHEIIFHTPFALFPISKIDFWESRLMRNIQSVKLAFTIFGYVLYCGILERRSLT